MNHRSLMRFITDALKSGDYFPTLVANVSKVIPQVDDSVIHLGDGTRSWDIKTFGNTSSDYMLWDASAGKMSYNGAAVLDVPAGQLQIGSTAITATAAEINQHCDISANVVTLTGTTVLTAADNGKTLILADATEFDTKLPAPALGLHFKFIVGLAPSSASYTITTNGTTQNVIHGVVSSAEDAAGAGANTSGTPVDVVTFVDSKAQVGDWVELVCDGTLWYLRGGCVQQDAITLA